MLHSHRAFLWILAGGLAGACSLRDLSDLEDGTPGSSSSGGEGGSEPTGGSAGSGGTLDVGGQGGMGGDGTGGEVEPLPKVAYSHTITCNGGGNDWIESEQEFTSSSGSAFLYRVSWDADKIYLYVKGSDFSGTPNRTITFYVGDGSMEGQDSGRSEPTTTVDLPYFAQHLIEVRLGSGTADLYGSDSSSWSVVSNLSSSTVFNVNSSSGLFELCLDRKGMEAHLPVGDDFLISASVTNGDDLDAMFGGFPAGALDRTYKDEEASFLEYFHFKPNEKAEEPRAPTDYEPVVP